MRSMYISPEQSAQLQKALIRIKVLDKNGEVRFDVRIVSVGWVGWGGGAAACRGRAGPALRCTHPIPLPRPALAPDPPALPLLPVDRSATG